VAVLSVEAAISASFDASFAAAHSFGKVLQDGFVWSTLM
jgi:hypothetical protein